MSKRMTRIGGKIGVWMYNTFNGRGSSGSKNVLVLMVTSPGRRTGIPRSTCVRYLETDEGPLVWGTGSGSKQDPDWFLNLRAADSVEVQVMKDRWQSRPRELVGAERDSVWNDVVLAQAPGVEKYARKAGRVIPVAVLEPIEG